jgi:hypothetical protein
MRGRCIAVTILTIWLMVGCERRSVTSTTTAPATEPSDAQAASATQPASSQPRACRMLVDQQRVEFPPAKVALRARGGQVLALLYSDDPPNAIDDDYTGNSFYLEMILDIQDVSQLGTARWMYKAPNSERAETTNGIYLDGRKRQLQPSDILVEFEGTQSPVKVWLRGQFLLFDSTHDPTMPGQIVPVSAELEAELVLRHGSG